MKRIKLFIHEPSINKVIGRELNLFLNAKAGLLDAIIEVDKIINSKGSFPIPDYRSLLHMIYNPVKGRFYKQVAVTAYKQSGQTLSVRDDPRKELPGGITVTLIPAGGCISEWEEPLSCEEFLKCMQPT
ncbi:MAG: hypothetical protein JSW19_01015 [Candidatus Bathyarchaeota archaeon]|nr:MAG: hypothetical protein JSW19_01015 [Candidatus Bathyarchaeota archaeon]